MPPVVSEWQGRWSALGPSRRRSLITWVATGVLALVAILVVLSQTPYVPVLTNLTPSSAGQVTTALQSLKIPYQLSNGGTTVLVPQADADQARIDLAMQNLPSNGQVGYQNLTGLSAAGMTSQQFTAAELGVLEQDLSATISGFQGVTGANVQIAVPPQSIWAAPVTGGTKASVYLDMVGGGAPTSSEVSGITALVAHAVPGLSASGVTVVDQSGQVMNSVRAASVNTPAGMFQEEQQLEAAGESQVRQLLIPVVGGNNLEVAVNIAIQPQHVTTTQTLPTKSQVSSSQTSKQTSTGTNGAAVAGAAGNTPGYALAPGGKSTSNSSSANRTYAVGTLVRNTVGPPVLVTGITASVVVNQKAFPLTTARRTAIQKLVAGALGIPAARAASSIVVSSAPFQQVTVAPPVSTLPLPLPELEGAAGGLVVIVVLLVVLLLRRRKGRQGEEPVSLADALLPQPAVPQGPPPRSRELVRQLGDLSTSAPEEVAAVLSQWLAQSEEQDP